MQRLDKAIATLKGLIALTGKIEKQGYIKLHKDNDDFLTLLFYRLNPYYAYKIKKFEVYPMSFKSLTFDGFICMLDRLRTSNINNSLRGEVVDMLATADHTYVDVLEGIITKGLSVGVDTAVNKALGWDFIPSFSCMLAAPLKEGDHVPLPAIVELKLDGVRCVARINKGVCVLKTRQGRDLHFPKIENALLRIANGEDLTFEGELTTEKRTDISGICNKVLKSGYVDGMDDQIIYSVFDVIPTEIFDAKGLTAKQRVRTLDIQIRMMAYTGDRIQLTPSYEVTTMSEIKKINNAYILDGYEGVIVKDPEAVYHYKRNKAWRKLKQVNQTTLKCIGTEEGKGKRKGKVGALICESSDGQVVVKVGSGMSDAEIDAFTKVSPIGKFVEVTYNVLIKGSDSDTYSLFLPRFESGAVVRIDKDSADSLQKIKDEHFGAMQI